MTAIFGQFSTFTWASLVSCIVALFWHFWWKRPHPKFPPGPRGFPVVGVLPYIKTFPHEMFKKWSLERYGDVMSVRMGSKDVVVLNTFESINEALLRQPNVFMGMADLHVYQQSARGLGIVFTFNEGYKRQRHFGLQVLKRGMFEKSRLDGIVDQESDHLIAALRKKEGAPFRILPLLYLASGNCIASALFGKGFGSDHAVFNSLLEKLHEMFFKPKLASATLMLLLFWNLRFLPHLYKSNKEILTLLYEMEDLCGELVNERKASFDSRPVSERDDENLDFVGAYIHEQRYGEGKNDPSFSDRQLHIYVRDLMGAGTETTSSQIAWSLICLLNFPEYHQPIVDEIVKFVDKGEEITHEKKDALHLTSAFLQEVLRFRPGAPIMHHKTTSSANLMGYVIPEGTQIGINIYGALWDPDLWPNPEKFDPGRHLDEDGSFIFSQKIIAFSVGPRYCMGEKLARVELFTFFVKILRNFHVECPPGVLPPLKASTANIVFSPEPFDVIIRERD